MMRYDREQPRSRSDPVEAVPKPGALAVYALQHVLAFSTGAALMPLLIAQGIGLDQADSAYIVNAGLLVTGIATVLQAGGVHRTGIKLPIVRDTATTAVAPLIGIGLTAGGGVSSLPTIYGAVVLTGLPLFVGASWFSRLVRFFPPLVTGTTLTSSPRLKPGDSRSVVRPTGGSCFTGMATQRSPQADTDRPPANSIPGLAITRQHERCNVLTHR